MRRPTRAVTLSVCALFLTMLWAPTPSAASTDDYLVNAPGSVLAEAGFAVVDDYGSFATASLTESDVVDLQNQGITVSELPRVVGRGHLALDPAAEGGAELDTETEYRLVQFRGPVKTEWRESLERKVAHVYDYVPHYTFLVKLSPMDVESVEQSPGVRAVVPYDPAFKLSPLLSESGFEKVTVLAYLDADVDTVISDIRATGAIVQDHATTRLEHVIDVYAHAATVERIAEIDAVSWIEPAFDHVTLDNADASAITQTATLGDYSVHDHGVDGRSQIASVCDSGVNTQAVQGTSTVGNLVGLGLSTMTHEMFDDNEGSGFVQYNHHLAPVSIQDLAPHRKVVLYYSAQENGNQGDSDDSHGHGTHTAGTLVGDAPPYGERNGIDGVAFAAKVAICDAYDSMGFHIINDYTNYWEPAYAVGARVNSNSWGSGHTSTYTEKARQHDDYTWTHRDFSIFRSMGNIASLIRTSASAKSAMGIGSTDNGAGMESISSFSGAGPTQDGRIKPNVVAPGSCLVSSYVPFENSQQCISGTSMSTPTVAGAATLIRDYFERGFYPSGTETMGDEFNPSSALVRAALQISGREIANDRGVSGFPNHVQGWGRVTLEDVLYFDGDARDTLVVDEATELATGDTETHSVTVEAGQDLRIMIAWSDQAGAAGANPAIVNDLDLTVTGPGGTYVGNAFVGSETPPNQGTADKVNVEEAVYLTAPAAGTYTIEVSGANVPDGPQSYALVITGSLK